MAEMAETACSDTAYLGYEYPASAGHSFADTLANHRPKYPVVLDAPTAHEISSAGISGSNNVNNDRDSNVCANSNAYGNTSGSINGNGQGYPNTNGNSHEIGHGVNNEDDIEVDNVRYPRNIHSRSFVSPSVASADRPASSGMARTPPLATGIASTNDDHQDRT